MAHRRVSSVLTKNKHEFPAEDFAASSYGSSAKLGLRRRWLTDRGRRRAFNTCTREITPSYFETLAIPTTTPIRIIIILRLTAPPPPPTVYCDIRPRARPTAVRNKLPTVERRPLVYFDRRKHLTA